MWSWSPISFFMSRGDVLKKSCPDLRSRNGSGFSPAFSRGGQLGQHGGFGLLQHAIEPPQHGEWQDHFAIFGLLVVAAQADRRRTSART